MHHFCTNASQLNVLPMCRGDCDRGSKGLADQDGARKGWAPPGAAVVCSSRVPSLQNLPLQLPQVCAPSSATALATGLQAILVWLVLSKCLLILCCGWQSFAEPWRAGQDNVVAVLRELNSRHEPLVLCQCCLVLCCVWQSFASAWEGSI